MSGRERRIVSCRSVIRKAAGSFSTLWHLLKRLLNKPQGEIRDGSRQTRKKRAPKIGETRLCRCVSPLFVSGYSVMQWYWTSD